MKKIPFHKMQGSGNDFILIDNRKAVLKGMNLRELAVTVCHRHYSVGADGLIVIVPSRRADFKWRFFNADGSEAEMCGNGSRCAARFAYLRKIAKKDMSFETLAGVIRARVKNGRVQVQLPGASGLRTNIAVPLDSGLRMGHFINTGVPHLVYLSKDIENEDVERIGRTTRYHELFKPAGTNVNFVQIAGALGVVSPPVEVLTSGGERLVVSFDRGADGFSNIHLEGGAEVICEGTVYV